MAIRYGSDPAGRASVASIASLLAARRTSTLETDPDSQRRPSGADTIDVVGGGAPSSGAHPPPAIAPKATEQAAGEPLTVAASTRLSPVAGRVDGERVGGDAGVQVRRHDPRRRGPDDAALRAAAWHT